MTYVLCLQYSALAVASLQRGFQFCRKNFPDATLDLRPLAAHLVP